MGRPTGSTSRRSGTGDGRRSGGVPTRSGSRSWSSTTRASRYHTVLDDASSATARNVEKTHYPRSGEANPKVRLGIVGGLGGAVQWADLSDYSPDSSLISEVGWWPDSSAAYCYVQDRAQTWLDLVKVAPGPGGQSVKRLFRDATKAWIDSPGLIHAYKDGTFLWLSERDGWKHIYQYASDGTLKAQLTSGPWEVRRLDHVDLEDGWIYFTGTREAPMSTDFYRVKPGSPIERLTQSPGTHTANMSPDGKLFLSSRSDIRTPDRIGLYTAEGKLVRTVDSNPSHELKRLRFGPHERFQIRARDGFLLEAELILPPDLEPGKKYPVWFTTYAGPHTPTISDAWSGGRMRDHAMAHEGFVIFHMDPRSASGKGAVSAWKAYKHLGVQETRRHQGRDQLAQAEALCGRVADRHERAQLRRVYHVVRHDPHRPVRRGDRRRAGDRLARL